MAHISMIVFCIVIIAGALAIPANKDGLDRVALEDDALNSVTSDKKAFDKKGSEDTVIEKNAKQVANSDSAVILETSSEIPVATKPRTPGTAVARIIDDIFQIPISVLQSVARLLRNPFVSHKTPETSSSY